METGNVLKIYDRIQGRDREVHLKPGDLVLKPIFMERESKFLDSAGLLGVVENVFDYNGVNRVKVNPFVKLARNLKDSGRPGIQKCFIGNV